MVELLLLFVVSWSREVYRYIIMRQALNYCQNLIYSVFLKIILVFASFVVLIFGISLTLDFLALLQHVVMVPT